MSGNTPESEGVQSLYQGINHDASWQRSYNADTTVYTHADDLRHAWQTFQTASLQEHRRRAVMRCCIQRELLIQLSDLPIEAAVPVGDEYLIWIGQNQHAPVSLGRDVRSLPQQETVPLGPNYSLDTEVRDEDIATLVDLWGQFGWTPDAVRSFVRTHAHGNPIALVRTMEQEAIGVMIAESVAFGAHRLVEITELAIHPSHRGQHLATILIRELSRLSTERWEDALVFGEYNLTTRSYQSAARAGHLPGQTAQVDGVLRDHVGITTGEGNNTISPWDTQWLHHFLVMYQPTRS